MKSEISKILADTLKKERINIPIKEIEERIEIPPNQEMGDFAFPCFFLSPILKKNPQEIAIKLKNEVKLSNNIKSVQVNGGYINFFVDKEDFSEKIINQILKEKENYGKTNIGKNEKVLVEHTSINPNASPHVGRSRNAFIGDSLVKILRFLNYNVEVHYFVNDVSKQIAMLVYGKTENQKFDSMLKKDIFDLLYKFEHNDKKIMKRFKKVTKICVDGQKKILSDLGIKYDSFDYESDYIGKAKKILLELEKTGKLFKHENRSVLDLKGTSIEGQMKSPVLVLTRSDGTGLYPLRDIAYTLNKISKAKENIIILGEDQKLYFQQLTEALKLLKKNYPKVVHYSFILLSEKGKSRKMSTRKGDVVLLEDFVEDAVKKAKKETSKRKTRGDPKKIAICAVKYSILKISPNKPINFNLEEALNFEGDTGPYLLYSYARASNILRKSKTKKQKNKKFLVNELNENEVELVKKLSSFPEIVLNSHKTLNPAIIANYSYHLAQIFNEFYHSSKVINSENENFRLKIVESFRIVLKNSLKLLGIETIDRM